jgi:hypothetical protein
MLAAGLALLAGTPVRAHARVDAKPHASEVFGTIRYANEACPGEEKEPWVQGATIVLERHGYRKASPVEFGTFDVKLGGSGSIKAYVELKSQFATITPFGANHPYRIPVNLHAGENEVLIRQKGQSAAANVATVIDHGAFFAKETLPAGATLPAVTVLLRYTTDFSHDETSVGDTAYYPKRRTIEIDNDPKHPTYKYEWESFAILHEYGHHVLDSLADAGSLQGGQHTLVGVYPDRPALAWSEGFADAFSALVTGPPRLTFQCRLIADIEATPATPSSKDPVEIDRAQYNEIQAAGVIWHLVNIGGGSRDVRMRQLLTAARAFKGRAGAGHYPESMREVRDALVGSPLEPDTLAGHDAIDKIFSDDHMGWGVAFLIDDVVIDNEGDDIGSFGQYLHLTLVGPYGTCEDPRRFGFHLETPITGFPGLTWDGGFVQGGLDSTWKDDCFIASGPAYDDLPHGLENNGELELSFPFLPEQRHANGEFKLYATFHCDPFAAQPPCGGSFAYQITLFHGWFQDTQSPPAKVDKAFSETADIVGHHSFVGVPLTLGDGEKTEILSFDSQGNCEIVPLHQDCSV